MGCTVPAFRHATGICLTRFQHAPLADRRGGSIDPARIPAPVTSACGTCVSAQPAAAPQQQVADLCCVLPCRMHKRTNQTCKFCGCISVEAEKGSVDGKT